MLRISEFGVTDYSFGFRSMPTVAPDGSLMRTAVIDKPAVGTIEESETHDWLVLEAQAETDYIVHLENARSIRVYDEGGSRLIAESNDGSDIRVTTDVATDLFVEVGDPEFADELWGVLFRTLDDDHGNSAATAARIEPTSITSGSLSLIHI